MINSIKFFFILIFLISASFNLKSKECINTDILKIGIIENDYIDYKYYLYYMLGEYTHSKSVKFELEIVENNIDEFDIIFGEYYDLYNLSINKINLPDKIKNFYTKSKINSEKIASNMNSIILRTNFFGKSFNLNRASFSDWIFNSFKNKKSIKLAEDIYFSPLSIETICKILVKIIKTKKIN